MNQGMILAGGQRLPKSVLSPKSNRQGPPLDVPDHLSAVSDMKGSIRDKSKNTLTTDCIDGCKFFP